MRRPWLGFVIAAAALAVGLWAWPHLAPRIPTHWNMRGVPDGYSPRLFAVLIVPAVIVVVNGMFRVLPRIDPRRVNYDKFRDTYWLFANAVCLFLLGIHVLVIANGLGYPVAMSRLLPAAMGLLFIVLGNYLSRVQPTWFVGIRTPWTLSSDAVWRKTHRTGGITFVVAGLVMVGAAFLSPTVNWIVLGIAVLGAVIVPVVQSYVLWRREQG
jgi:immunity protein, SdpI family